MEQLVPWNEAVIMQEDEDEGLLDAACYFLPGGLLDPDETDLENGNFLSKHLLVAGGTSEAIQTASANFSASVPLEQPQESSAMLLPSFPLAQVDGEISSVSAQQKEIPSLDVGIEDAKVSINAISAIQTAPEALPSDTQPLCALGDSVSLPEERFFTKSTAHAVATLSSDLQSFNSEPFTISANRLGQSPEAYTETQTYSYRRCRHRPNHPNPSGSGRLEQSRYRSSRTAEPTRKLQTILGRKSNMRRPQQRLCSKVQVTHSSNAPLTGISDGCSRCWVEIFGSMNLCAVVFRGFVEDVLSPPFRWCYIGCRFVFRFGCTLVLLTCRILLNLVRMSFYGLAAGNRMLRFGLCPLSMNMVVLQAPTTMLSYFCLCFVPVLLEILMNSLSLPSFVPLVLFHLLSFLFLQAFEQRLVGSTVDSISRRQKVNALASIQLLRLLQKIILTSIVLLDTTFFQVETSTRVISAYAVSLVANGLVLSPLAIVCWGFQVVLVSLLPKSMVLDVVITAVGLSTIFVLQELLSTT